MTHAAHPARRATHWRSAGPLPTIPTHGVTSANDDGLAPVRAAPMAVPAPGPRSATAARAERRQGWTWLVVGVAFALALWAVHWRLRGDAADLALVAATLCLAAGWHARGPVLRWARRDGVRSHG